jgi:hypothetical protein
VSIELVIKQVSGFERGFELYSAANSDGPEGLVDMLFDLGRILSIYESTTEVLIHTSELLMDSYPGVSWFIRIEQSDGYTSVLRFEGYEKGASCSSSPDTLRGITSMVLDEEIDHQDI